MTWVYVRRQTLWFGLLLQAGCFAGAAAGAKQPRPDARLTVRLYNYAGIDEGTLVDAKRRAIDVFLAAGIGLSWVDCPISNDDVDKFRACSQVRDALGFLLRIVPPSMVRNAPRAPGVFGVASDVDAQILAGRVWDFVDRYDIPAALVFGTVMAHEVGHLLLGSDSHSSIGLMRSRFSQEDFRLPRMGLLTFTGTQRKRMRARLRRNVPVESSRQALGDH